MGYALHMNFKAEHKQRLVPFQGSPFGVASKQLVGGSKRSHAEMFGRRKALRLPLGAPEPEVSQKSHRVVVHLGNCSSAEKLAQGDRALAVLWHVFAFDIFQPQQNTHKLHPKNFREVVHCQKSRGNE